MNDNYFKACVEFDGRFCIFCSPLEVLETNLDHHDNIHFVKFTLIYKRKPVYDFTSLYFKKINKNNNNTFEAIHELRSD